ncbi:A-kinase anchor protein 7 isoforms alpha and beta [Camelus dromedarius]|uniref:A-kinase anchor protein 7 isoforms alpha and beta n=1 Tax=Camelus dromedarius TaxID=9838 RepID=A0A5N4DVQ3_CAMDR|nr:A-kinase anchor protein 7 isoforms alpha and beta [Camelus dromedarius]
MSEDPGGDKNGGEPDDAELVRLSKRLVENAVLKAVQQYLEETQNKNKPGDGSSVKTEEADRNGTDSKKPIGIQDLINEALHRERMALQSKVKQIKELLLKPETQAKIRRELFEGRSINNSNQGSDVDFSTTLT